MFLKILLLINKTCLNNYIQHLISPLIKDGITNFVANAITRTVIYR